ncbi:cobalamin biosynthesis protein [Kitasatospora sp. SUK 42]|uniref:cobalamin biosynthesis protein n=1 Tax=Kitasatospora sp. SUK 42 TaxID=1588882 RepID=UPI0027E26291|nr:cobalamin biosynthesis protein [Kitasatospora sp. SUK 42]
MVIGLVAVYEPGRPLTDELHALWPDSSHAYRASRGNCFQAPEAMNLAFTLHRQVIVVGPLATVVHLLADLHRDLRRDTDVLCVDPLRRWVIPLTHGDSAEELAREVEAALGVTPVFTGSSPQPEAPSAPEEAPVLRITDQEDPGDGDQLVRPRTLVVGIGAGSGTEPAEAMRLLTDTLREAGLARPAVARLATVAGKADHPAVRWVAHCLGGVPVDEHPARELAAVPVPNPSSAVGAAVGTASVAEAAALASAPGGRLVVAKRKSATATVAIARAAVRGRLAVIGLPPGAQDHPEPEPLAELRRASAVVGTPEAVEAVAGLLRPTTRLVPVDPDAASAPNGAGTVSDGAGAVLDRTGAAAHLAAHGHAVALVTFGEGDGPTVPPGPYEVHRVPGPQASTQGDPA